MYRIEDMYGFVKKNDYISNSQWDVYCKHEGITHRSIDLLDESMIIRKKK